MRIDKVGGSDPNDQSTTKCPWSEICTSHHTLPGYNLNNKYQTITAQDFWPRKICSGRNLLFILYVLYIYILYLLYILYSFFIREKSQWHFYSRSKLIVIPKVIDFPKRSQSWHFFANSTWGHCAGYQKSFAHNEMGTVPIFWSRRSSK